MAPAVFRLTLSEDKQRIICYYKNDVATKGDSLDHVFLFIIYHGAYDRLELPPGHSYWYQT